MELLSIITSFILDQAGTTVRNRLQRTPPGWAAQTAAELGAAGRVELTPSETAAVQRWINASEVRSLLLAADPSQGDGVVEKVVPLLAFELGAPTEEGDAAVIAARASEIASATVAHLALLVEPGTAATLAVHETVRRTGTVLADGQAEIYEKVLQILDAVGASLEQSEPSSALHQADVSAASDAVSIQTRSAVRAVRAAGEQLASRIGKRAQLGSSLQFFIAKDHYNAALGDLGEAMAATALLVDRVGDPVLSDLFGHLGTAVAAIPTATNTPHLPGADEAVAVASSLAERASTRIEFLRQELK